MGSTSEEQLQQRTCRYPRGRKKLLSFGLFVFFGRYKLRNRVVVDLQEDRAPLWTGDASNFQQGRTDVSNRLQKEVWYFRWMIMNQIQGKKLP